MHLDVLCAQSPAPSWQSGVNTAPPLTSHNNSRQRRESSRGRDRQQRAGSVVCSLALQCTHRRFLRIFLRETLKQLEHAAEIRLRLFACSRRMLRTTDGAVVFIQELGGEYSNRAVSAKSAQTVCVWGGISSSFLSNISPAGRTRGCLSRGLASYVQSSKQR